MSEDPRKSWKRQADYIRAKRILRLSCKLAVEREVSDFSSELEAL